MAIGVLAAPATTKSWSRASAGHSAAPTVPVLSRDGGDDGLIRSACGLREKWDPRLGAQSKFKEQPDATTSSLRPRSASPSSSHRGLPAVVARRRQFMVRRHRTNTTHRIAHSASSPCSSPPPNPTPCQADHPFGLGSNRAPPNNDDKTSTPLPYPPREFVHAPDTPTRPHHVLPHSARRQREQACCTRRQGGWGAHGGGLGLGPRVFGGVAVG